VKLTLSAAMRARDVSRPRPEDAAEALDETEEANDTDAANETAEASGSTDA
jgi:hypothetical protein